MMLHTLMPQYLPFTLLITLSKTTKLILLDSLQQEQNELKMIVLLEIYLQVLK